MKLTEIFVQPGTIDGTAARVREPLDQLRRARQTVTRLRPPFEVTPPVGQRPSAADIAELCDIMELLFLGCRGREQIKGPRHRAGRVEMEKQSGKLAIERPGRR